MLKLQFRLHGNIEEKRKGQSLVQEDITGTIEPTTYSTIQPTTEPTTDATVQLFVQSTFIYRK
jgi:hypothetical protein